MIEATGQPRSRLCTACFTGDYPIPLPESSLLGKHLLEALPGLESAMPRRQDAEGVGTGVSGGAADALTRP
jgi:amidophosphoribosyltransferase